MVADVEKYVQTCSRCIQRKTPAPKAPLVPIVTSQPLEVVSMDHLTLEPSKGGHQHILVITDFFTRYAVSVPIQNLSAITTAKAFINNFVVHYGIPQRIHSDQGGAFESRVVKELCNLLGIKKSRTTAFHPEGNGVTERFNRTLLQMLGTLDAPSKLDWKTQVAPLVHAYNCAPHAATGYSPYFLMFGRHPNLPIDIAMNVDRSTNSTPTVTEFATELRDRLTKSYDLARRLSGISKLRQKQLRDRKSQAAVLAKGDKVLVRKLHFSGKHKLANKWEPDIFVVIDQPNDDIPVYVVEPEVKDLRNRRRRTQRTVHRNHLLPIGSLLDPEIVPSEEPSVSRHEKRPDSDDTSEQSESDDDDHYTPGSIPVETETANPAEHHKDDSVGQPGETSAEGAVVPQPTTSASPPADVIDESACDVPDQAQSRYNLRRNRKPPERWGYSHPTNASRKLDIAQQLMQFLNDK